MGKYGETEIHTAALTLTLAMGVAMFFLRRDRAVVAFLLVACLVTHAQRIVVAGLDFSMLRIVILFGWARILSRGEAAHYRFQPLDGVLPIWLAFGTLAYIIGPRGSMDSLVQRLGVTFDAVGTYFLFRILLRDVRDIHRTVAAFGWIALLMVAPMVLENLTGRNAFAVLGGVREQTVIRDGRLRCQASFSHPIMAGNFGASTVALLGALWLGFPKQRLRHSAALAAATGITLLSASSGPLIAFLVAILAWALWPYRRFMPFVQWGTVAALVVIHFAREKPVWHLIGRVSSITGGTGWHRYSLIDEFINHFDEWWLVGTYSTAHWKIAYTSSDITNQYVLEGVRGGLPTLLSFAALLAVAFWTVGRSVRRAWPRGGSAPPPRRRAALLAWGLGTCLTVHSVAFIGVSYFGQLLTILYLHLALIPSLACALSRPRGRRVVSKTSGMPRRSRGRPTVAQPARIDDRVGAAPSGSQFDTRFPGPEAKRKGSSR
jgi:hypothetical protein